MTPWEVHELTRKMMQRDPTRFELWLCVVLLMSLASLVVCGLWWVWSSDAMMIGKIAMTSVIIGGIAFIAIQAVGD